MKLTWKLKNPAIALIGILIFSPACFGEESEKISNPNYFSTTSEPHKENVTDFFGTDKKGPLEYSEFIKRNSNYLKVKYEKIKSETLIKNESSFGFNELNFSDSEGNRSKVGLQVISKVPNRPSKNYDQKFTLLIFAYGTDGLQFKNCNDFSFSVDGKSFLYLKEHYDGYFLDVGSTLEGLSIELNQEQMDKLQSAKNAFFIICGKKFVFGKKHFWILRWLNEKTKNLHTMTGTKE